MTVGSDHHGDLDTLRTKSGDAPGPFSFDQGSPFQPEAKFGEELDGGIDVFHHDADVVRTVDCHAVSLTSNARIHLRPSKRARAWPSGGMRCEPGYVFSVSRMLGVVDGEPSFWPHTNKHAADEVPRAFDIPVAQLGAEITAREGAPIALEICRFDRDDRPLHADVLIRRRFRLYAETESARAL